ncbi:lipopolysaccharide biosynthesis protein [Salinarimonas sp.]|uniref:lipopolysaccharide biosynthesis protein n=1 Tax=Salinarimonas sp. TaxID=2766526 RepID=UPI0032D9759E
MPSRIERLFASSVTVTAVRLVGAGAGFLAQLVMAKNLGATALGLFYAVTSLITVLAMLAIQGYPAVTTRFVARYRERPSLTAAFVRAAARHAALGTAVAAAGLAGVALAWPFESGEIRAGLLIGAACLPFLAMLGHSAAVAAANRRFDIAYVPESLARPVLFLAGVVALAALGAPASGPLVIGLFAAVTAGVALVQTALASRLVPRVPSAPVRPRLSRRWRREAWGAAIVALFVGAFADVAIVLAAPLMAKADTAVFGLCLKLSFLVGFLVQAAHHVASPDLADARRAGDAARLGSAMRKAVILPVAATLAATLGALALGGPVLGLFGPEFGAGAGVLVLLLAAQAVRAIAGPSVTMLTLTGAQAQNAALCVMALAVLAAASLLLVPTYAALGAAGAVFLATLAWQIGVAMVLRRRGEPGTDLLTLAREAARRRAAAAA